MASSSEMSNDSDHARLDRMPKELVSHIAARLGSDDLFSLRLTCRALSVSTFYDFSTEYFSSKCFIINSDSLRVLVAISQHSELREKVRTIYISSAFFEEDSQYGTGRAFSIRQQQAWADYANDQNELRITGKDRKLLREAFRSLPGLQKLHIIDNNVLIEEQNTDIRGRVKVRRVTGRDPLVPTAIYALGTDYDRHFRRVINITFDALAKSNIQLEDFGVKTSRAGDGVSVRNDLTSIDKLLPGLTTAFKSTRRLVMSINGETVPKCSHEMNNQATKNVLRRFGECFGPSLTEVDLSFDHNPNTHMICPGLLAGFYVSNIEKLTLKRAQVHARTLGMVLQNARALEDIRLISVNLMTGSWIPMLKLLQRCKSLKHVHLMFLSERDLKAYFLRQVEEDDEQDTEQASDSSSEGSSEGSSEDDMPPLEDAENSDSKDDSTEEGRAEADESSFLLPRREEELEYEQVIGDKEFKLPNTENIPERGYYVCLSTRREVEVALPEFIEQYNVGGGAIWNNYPSAAVAFGLIMFIPTNIHGPTGGIPTFNGGALPPHPPITGPPPPPAPMMTGAPPLSQAAASNDQSPGNNGSPAT